MLESERKLVHTGFALSAVLAVLAAFALLLPAPKSPFPFFVGLDKVVHFSIFFLVALPSLMTGPRNWIWLVPVISGFGLLIELIQPHFGRGAEVGDAIANTLGVLCAVPLGRWGYLVWLQPWQMAKVERAKRYGRLPDGER